MEPVTFGPKPVEDEPPVSPQHLGSFLLRLEPRACGARAPSVQKLAGPGGKHVLPEELEVLFEQVNPYRLQVAAQEFLECDILFLGEVLWTLEQAPAGLCQHEALSFILKIFDIRGTDLVCVTRDVESLQDVHRLSPLLSNDPKVGFPYVAADEPKSAATGLPKLVEEPPHGLLRALLPDPEQSLGVIVDLIDERDVLVLPFAPSDFVHADRGYSVEIVVFQAPGDRHLNRTNHIVPDGTVNLGHHFPTQPFGLTDQKPSVGGRQVALALRPQYPLDFHLALGAVHRAQRVEKKEGDSPQVDELKPPHRQGVVSRLSLATARAQRSIPRPRPDLYAQHHVASLLDQLHTSVHEARLALDPIENGIDLHPALFSLMGVPHKHPYQDRERVASFHPSLRRVAATRHRRYPPRPRRSAGYPQIMRTNRKAMTIKDKRSTSYEQQPRDCQRTPGSSDNFPVEGSRGFGFESHTGIHRLPIDISSLFRDRFPVFSHSRWKARNSVRFYMRQPHRSGYDSFVRQYDRTR